MFKGEKIKMNNNANGRHLTITAAFLQGFKTFIVSGIGQGVRFAAVEMPAERAHQVSFQVHNCSSGAARLEFFLDQWNESEFEGNEHSPVNALFDIPPANEYQSFSYLLNSGYGYSGYPTIYLKNNLDNRLYISNIRIQET